ncbi:MAG: hypothetical protein GY809_19285 [Planctomycetes bacterium]|nr:hypothetical protein [Planctomycetota bacterium]
MMKSRDRIAAAAWVVVVDAVYKRLSRVHRGLRKCIELRLNNLEATES